MEAIYSSLCWIVIPCSEIKVTGRDLFVISSEKKDKKKLTPNWPNLLACPPMSPNPVTNPPCRTSNSNTKLPRGWGRPKGGGGGEGRRRVFLCEFLGSNSLERPVWYIKLHFYDMIDWLHKEVRSSQDMLSNQVCLTLSLLRVNLAQKAKIWKNTIV